MGPWVGWSTIQKHLGFRPHPWVHTNPTIQPSSRSGDPDLHFLRVNENDPGCLGEGGGWGANKKKWPFSMMISANLLDGKNF